MNEIDDFFNLGETPSEFEYSGQEFVEQGEFRGQEGVGTGRKVRQPKQPRQPKQSKQPRQPKQSKSPKSPKQPKPITTNNGNGHWGIKSIALSLISIIMIILTYGNITGNSVLDMFGKRGIVANMPEVISGYTISQLAEMEFTVDNKSRRDSSEGTTWYFDGTEIGKGTNKIKIDQNLFNWGPNILEAENGEDYIMYTIMLEKSQSDTDKLHNMLSMLIDYKTGWFATSQSYSPVDSTTLGDLVKSKYDVVDYGNGFIKTKQEFGDGLIVLETTESTVYSLEIGRPIQIPESISNGYAVQIRGNWDTVEEATLSFDLQGESEENWVPMMFKNGKLSNINKDKYIYSNGKLIVTIKDSGIYLIRQSGLDNNNLKIRYDIGILELSDTDKINNTELNGVEATLGPAPAESQLNTEYYKGFLDSLSADADEKTKIDIKTNILTWSNNVAMLNKNDIKFIRDYTNSTVENAVLSLVDRDQVDTYSKNALLIFDVSKLSNEKVRQVANLISRLEDYDTYNLKFIIIGSKVKNIRTLDSISDSTILYELSSISEATAMIQSLNASFVIGSEVKAEMPMISGTEASETGNTAEKVETVETKLIRIADTQFSFDKNAILDECDFNENIQGSNSFGQSLLVKLAFNGQFRADYLSGGNPLREGYTESIDGMKLNITGLGVTLDKETEGKLNSARIGEIDKAELKKIIDTLTLSQLNYSGSSLITPEKFSQNGGYSYFIEALSNELNAQGPVLATIGCQYGYESVLITALSEDKDHSGNYYIHFYNPMNPTEEQIVTLTVIRGINEETKNIGYTNQFRYEFDGIEFNSLSLVSPISIYSDNEEAYRVEILASK